MSFYDKRQLPNHSVFLESRYFHPGSNPFLTFTIKGHSFGVLICEDIWHPHHLQKLKTQNIETLISINASPYYQDKFEHRIALCQQPEFKDIHHIYVNAVGGQDEFLFDGQSFVLNQKGEIVAKAHAFKEQLLHLEFKDGAFYGDITPALNKTEELYQALSLSLADFANKNHLQKAVLGLSGGIDSALTLVIAAHALGHTNVHALLMPSPYTAQMSIDDAITLCQTLKVSYDIIPISHYVQEFKGLWKNPLNDLSQQNIQARIRGLILMTYANQEGALLLATSNKSETAVGYCTLYGDMCGGFSVLKDLYKTQVYALAEFINQDQEIIPSRIITRPPTAELAPNQLDQDDLPPYAILDNLLIDILEKRMDEASLKQKYEPAMVDKIFKRIKTSEFKRFQAAPGTKVSPVAFGRDWRFPISNAWKI